MCELATASLVMAGASAVVGGVGQMQAGAAAKAAGQYQAQVARNNAIIANYNADDALKRGQVEEQKYRGQVSQLVGRQRAVLAANGVVVDEGSALDITSDTRAVGELDALTIRYNSEREAYNYRRQGDNFTSDANLLDMRASQSESAAMLGTVSTLLSGAGSVADKWYQFKSRRLVA